MKATHRIATSNWSAITGAICLVVCFGTPVTAQSSKVRLALVNTPEDLLRELLPVFEKEGGAPVEVVYVGEDPWSLARTGGADMVIAHYGHVGTEAFVTDGLGLWPVMVFANQAVLVGPVSDPAGVRGLPDVVHAFRHIAWSGSRFLVNNAASEVYLTNELREAAGRRDAGEWYVDQGLRDQEVVEAAAAMGAYTLWGLPPFLRYQSALTQSQSRAMEVLVSDDPLLQRVMVSIVVNPAKVAGINTEGAIALQRFLVQPSTQARIRAFRYPGLDQQAWWPFGRHNSARRLQ